MWSGRATPYHLDGEPPGPAARALLHLGVPQAWAHARDLLIRLIRDIGGWAPGLPADLTGQDPLVAHYHGL